MAMIKELWIRFKNEEEYNQKEDKVWKILIDPAYHNNGSIYKTVYCLEDPKGIMRSSKLEKLNKEGMEALESFMGKDNVLINADTSELKESSIDEETLSEAYDICEKITIYQEFFEISKETATEMIKIQSINNLSDAINDLRFSLRN